MDKAEYHLRLEELTKYVENRDYAGALTIVDNIEWRRVKSIRTLNMVADVYEANKRYGDCKKILLLAYDRASIGKSILYRLVEICLKLGELDEAVDFYTEFAEVAPHDNSRFILKYKIYKARRSPLQDQIAILEEYKNREYTERWAYELAVLYSKAGDQEKCVETCDDMILWFSEGKYVRKAMELKQKYQPLSPIQEAAYRKELERQAAVRKLPFEKPDEFLAAEAAAVGTGKILEKMDQAGAAVTKDVSVQEEPETGTEAEAEESASVTSKEFMGENSQSEGSAGKEHTRCIFRDPQRSPTGAGNFRAGSAGPHGYLPAAHPGTGAGSGTAGNPVCGGILSERPGYGCRGGADPGADVSERFRSGVAGAGNRRQPVRGDRLG